MYVSRTAVSSLQSRVLSLEPSFRAYIWAICLKAEFEFQHPQADIKCSIAKLYMLSWESEWFHKLGNEIMLQLASEVDPIDAEKLKLLGRDTPQKRNERLTKVRESMKATTSRHAYGDYPWNAVSLALRLLAYSCLQYHYWYPISKSHNS